VVVFGVLSAADPGPTPHVRDLGEFKHGAGAADKHGGHGLPEKNRQLRATNHRVRRRP